jgi:hypothetical protein
VVDEPHEQLSGKVEGHWRDRTPEVRLGTFSNDHGDPGRLTSDF